MTRRIVLVTGASSGIGMELVRLLAARGDIPVLAARNAGALQSLKQEIGTGEIFPCDVTDENQASQLIRETVRRFGRLDVLVNNAGYGRFGGALDIPMDDYRGMMETNYLGAVRLTLEAIPHMLRQGGGRIVNISSVAGLTGIPNLAGYSASKFALVGFSEAVNLEYSPHIRVGVLCPGPVSTPFFGGRRSEELFPELVARQMLDARTVAEHAVRLIDRPRFLVIPAAIRWALRFRGWFPGLYRHAAKKVYRPLMEQGGIRSQI
jgi:uncharacterized protein